MGEARRKRLRAVATLEEMDVPRKGHLRLSIVDLGGPVVRAAIPLDDLERLAVETGAFELPAGATIDQIGATLDGWRSLRNLVFDATNPERGASRDESALRMATHVAVWCLFHGLWEERVREVHRQASHETGAMTVVIYRDRNMDRISLLADARELDDDEALRALADESVGAIERQQESAGGVQ